MLYILCMHAVIFNLIGRFITCFVFAYVMFHDDVCLMAYGYKKPELFMIIDLCFVHAAYPMQFQ